MLPPYTGPPYTGPPYMGPPHMGPSDSKVHSDMQTAYNNVSGHSNEFPSNEASQGTVNRSLYKYTQTKFQRMRCCY